MSEVSEDVKKLTNSINRIASAAVGLAWQECVGYHMATFLGSHACCAMLIYLGIANTDEIQVIVSDAMYTAIKQYYKAFLPRAEPLQEAPFKFVKEGAKAP